MPEKFVGPVQILDASTPGVARITLFGQSGSAEFEGDRSDSPSTSVANDHIAIGQKSRRAGKPLKPPVVRPGRIDPDAGVAAPPSGTAVDTSKEPKAFIKIGDELTPGGLYIADAKGQTIFKVNGFSGSVVIGVEGNAGDLYVLDEKGEISIHLNGVTGDIELTGADCAEEFDVELGESSIEPGTVVTIGDTGVSRSRFAYDKRVAGIVSGAGAYRPGIVLGKVRRKRERVPLALSGKAYCKVDATYAAVEKGDLLTTSDTPGFAMKAMDQSRCFGTVIGKALESLSSGQGCIPVLIALQ